MDHPIGAVRDDVDGIEILVLRQVCFDLIKAVFEPIENKNVEMAIITGIAGDIGNHPIEVIKTFLEDYQFVAGRWIVRRFGSV